MIKESRQNAIVEYIDRNQSLSVSEIAAALDVSEITVRRDIVALDKEGRLLKVYGGATSLANSVNFEYSMAEKEKLFVKEKTIIAKYAAGLIKPKSFVFLDAGTTTKMIVKYLNNNGSLFVTNSWAIANELAKKNLETLILGGKIKIVTGAIVGSKTIIELQSYCFDICFIGADGIHAESGFSTLSHEEASIKSIGLDQSTEKYIVSDSSKFDVNRGVRFAAFDDYPVITCDPPPHYSKYKNIISVPHK
jgi:DeoR family fructose operon transcriptional repressor